MSDLTYTTSRESKRQAARLASRRDQNSTDVAGSETLSGVPAAATAARRKPVDAAVQAYAKYWSRCHELRINDSSGTWRVLYGRDCNS